MPLYYHISPERVSRLHGRYNQRFQSKGIFVCRTMNAITSSWAEYVAHKKTKNIKRPQPRPDHPYKTLYLYTIDIPHKTIQSAKDFYQQHEERAFSDITTEDKMKPPCAWSWDEELFIPETMLESLQITSCKEYSLYEIQDMARERGHRDTITKELRHPKPPELSDKQFRELLNNKHRNDNPLPDSELYSRKVK